MTSSVTAPPDMTSPGRRVYLVLAVVWCVQLLNLVDRGLPAILAEPIKQDLGFSDFQIGMLNGLAFTLVYSLAGLPLAWLADRTSRRWVLAGAAGLWSAMTMLGGLAQSFLQIVVTRMGVGLGEAACQPVAHAIIAESFPQERRGAMIGVFTLTVPLAALVSMGLGGWIAETFGWRHAMVAIGAPGLGFALILLLVVRDRRTKAASKVDIGAVAAGLRLWRIPVFLHGALGLTLLSLANAGFHAFSGPFLIRTQGLTVGQAGVWLGLTSACAGLAGTGLSAVVVDRLGRERPGRAMLLTGIALALALPFFVATWLAPTAAWSLVLLVPWLVASNTAIVPTFTVAQSVAPPETRAFASAMIYTCVGILGAGLGPLLTGWVSDVLQPRMGVDSLRYGLCLMVLPQLWAIGHYLRAATVRGADRSASPLQAHAQPEVAGR
jgi:predicted MFS family arabinose efflux permease